MRSDHRGGLSFCLDAEPDHVAPVELTLYRGRTLTSRISARRHAPRPWRPGSWATSIHGPGPGRLPFQRPGRREITVTLEPSGSTAAPGAARLSCATAAGAAGRGRRRPAAQARGHPAGGRELRRRRDQGGAGCGRAVPGPFPAGGALQRRQGTGQSLLLGATEPDRALARLTRRRTMVPALAAASNCFGRFGTAGNALSGSS